MRKYTNHVAHGRHMTSGTTIIVASPTWLPLAWQVGRGLTAAAKLLCNLLVVTVGARGSGCWDQMCGKQNVACG